MNRIQDLTNGRWPDLLQNLGGLSSDQLTDRHQPCPLCGGKDRYRFDDQNGTGSWFCNQCGGKDHQGGGGSGMDLLMRVKSWDFKTAARAIEQHLGIAPSIPNPPTKGAENVWQYTKEFYVCRFPGKKIRPLWFDGTSWKWKAPPEPRPIYNLLDLHSKPEATVIIAEGEKAADAAAKLFPEYLATTWPSGCKAFNKADWSPLEARTVILWPDADDVGRQAMAKLAPKLLQAGAYQVFIVTPPENATEGWDLADAIWSPNEARDYLDSHLSEPITLPDDPTTPEPEPEPITAADPLPETDEHFICIGFQENTFYYQPFSTGQVVALARGSHTGTNLCALAPLSYWENLYPNKTGVNWIAAASSLFQRCYKAGFYNPAMLRGRGAWWDNCRSVLHLGDRIIVDGFARPSNKQLENSSFYYQRLISLQGPNLSDPLSKKDAEIILTIAGKFLWETKGAGMLIAGWVALAPVCGILDWRPHIWLTAGAGSGKSTLLEDFVAPLLGDMSLIVVGNTSEAGIRQSLKSDALPVVFDEAESNEKSDQARIQSILSLARVASFESDANILKGSPEGSMQNFKIRSMFMFSSIATGLKQGADKSRFAQITLKKPEDRYPDKEVRQKHWDDLRKSLSTEISQDTGRKLQARIFTLIPVVKKSIAIFTEAAAEYLDGNQRNGDQYGTLLAGTWVIYNDEPPTKQEALDLCKFAQLDEFCKSNDKPDEKRCIDLIMQYQLKIEGDSKTVTRTIGELVEIAANKALDRDLLKSTVEATLGRNGIKIDRGKVCVSNSSSAIASILRDTQWSNSWSDQLERLPGALKVGSIYFKGMGSSARAVGVPFDAL